MSTTIRAHWSASRSWRATLEVSAENATGPIGDGMTASVKKILMPILSRRVLTLRVRGFWVLVVLTLVRNAHKIKLSAASRLAAITLAAPSFNGRTADSGSAYRGSNPWGAAKVLACLWYFPVVFHSDLCFVVQAISDTSAIWAPEPIKSLQLISDLRVTYLLVQNSSSINVLRNEPARASEHLLPGQCSTFLMYLQLSGPLGNY